MMIAGFWGYWGLIVALGSIYIILMVLFFRKDSKIQLLYVGLWRDCLPELDLFPSHERGSALRRATNNWQTTLSMSAVAILGYVTIRHFQPTLYGLIPLPSWVVGLILGLIFGGMFYWGAWLTRARIRRSLRQELISDGFIICEPCGYDLRGLTEPRCPECGTPFEMSNKSETVSDEAESSQQDATADR